MIGHMLSRISGCITAIFGPKMVSRTPARYGKGGQRESELGMISRIEQKAFLKTLNAGKRDKIVLKFGSNNLYFDFNYNGRQEKSTGRVFSIDNALLARKELDEIMGAIQAGTFCFAARFPEASIVARTLHTQQESHNVKRRPGQITIAEFIVIWMTESLPLLPVNQQKDYLRDINYWLIPLYGHLTFAEFTGHALHVSLGKYRRGKKENGSPLSGIRVKNIFTPLRLIWNSATSKYGWKKELDNPFDYLTDNRIGPKREENPTRSLLFAEYENVRQHLGEYDYQIAEIKALTGMIDSEMAGLRKSDIFFNHAKPYLHIRNKIVRDVESDELKTDFRPRMMHITNRIRQVLEYFLAQSPDNYVFTQQDGTKFQGEDFRKAWAKAMAAAGIEYVRPYCLRHCFSGWSKSVDIQLSWLQSMMGHASLELLFKRYGHHQFGHEDERDSIIKFFGVDYLRLGESPIIINLAKAAKAANYPSPKAHKKAA